MCLRMAETEPSGSEDWSDSGNPMEIDSSSESAKSMGKYFAMALVCNDFVGVAIYLPS